MNTGTLLVRTDANIASGTGHVMRCLALAQAWRNQTGEALFAMAQSTGAIRERLQSEAVRTITIQAVPGSAEDLQQTIDAAISHNAEWLLLDGYHFNAHYLSEVQKVCPTLFIDDNGELESYSSDLVLNQNAHARPDMYANRMPRTRLLLGPSYALLRNEFVAYRDWTRKIAKRGTRILLTMGGSDPRNLTPAILFALAALTLDGLPTNDLRIRVVVGGSAENQNSVAAVVEKVPQRVEMISNATNMAELMAWADLAIAGAGTTCWEMCLLSLPAILVVVAENQKIIAGHLDVVGAAVNAGPAEAINCTSLARLAAEILEDTGRRLQMSQTAKQLVDGRGRDRTQGDADEGCIMRLICLVNNYLGWQALEYLRKNAEIAAVVVHPPDRIKFEAEIIASARAAGATIIAAGELRRPEGLEKIAELHAELGMSVMFGYLLKPDFLRLLPNGCMNLHPAYLPYNRGAHPNVWSIVDQTPAGVTLHYIDEGIDTGDIIRQKEVPVSSTDTGETLYRKLEVAGLQLLRDTWPDIEVGDIVRTKQLPAAGTFHKAADALATDEIRLADSYRAGGLLNLLRARTFPPHKGAFFRNDGRKVYVRIQFEEETDGNAGEK